MKNLIAFSLFLVVVAFSFVSCEQQNLDDDINTIPLVTLNGFKLQKDDIQPIEANTSEIQLDKENFLRSSDYFYNVHKSEGLIYDDGYISRLSWDVNFYSDYLYNYNPSGQASFIYDNGSTYFDLSMKNVCAIVTNEVGDRALNVFRVSEINAVEGNNSLTRSFSSYPYVIVWTKQRSDVYAKHRYSQIYFMGAEYIEAWLNYLDKRNSQECKFILSPSLIRIFLQIH